MKVESTLFGLLAVFLLVVAGIYWFFSEEAAGTTMILLSGGLALMVGYYLWFTARRLDARPEDRPDADISEGSGEVGFFAPHSWWPIAMAGAATFTTVGMTIGRWMVVMGAIALVVTVFGLLFEYYWGVNRSQAQTIEALEAMGEPATAPTKWLQ
ncbi:MAG: ctaF [Frankiales bacterium]|nr:ctaF [Frankiales bacterium]